MMETIVSPKNSQLKRLAQWASKSRARREAGVMVAEGVHLLAAALAAGVRPEMVYVPEPLLHDAEMADLLNKKPDLPVRAVAEGLLRRISALADAETVMAIFPLPQNDAWDDAADTLALQGVQDPGNLGTVLRSALASGVRQVVLDAACADVWSPKVLRAGMGAHFALRFQIVEDWSVWRQNLCLPLRVTALHRESVSLYACDLTTPCVWLFGNEGAGVSDEMLQTADELVHIPMHAACESLNVAMAATVCLFEQQRQRLEVV